MSTRRQIGGEGASASWSQFGSGTSGLIVCPMISPGVGVDAATIQEIYRLAYEWARVASRPSAYEMALHASCN